LTKGNKTIGPERRRIYSYRGDENGNPPGMYLTATAAAEYLHKSKTWFYDKIKNVLMAHKLPTLDYALYLQADLDALPKDENRPGKDENKPGL
jgi:hypothetical protein